MSSRLHLTAVRSILPGTQTGVLQIDESSFDHDVLHAEGDVLVDFSATWCGPCKILEPVLEALSKERALRIVKVDVDASPALVRRYGVRGAPTLVLFRNGEPIRKHIGATSKQRLIESLGLSTDLEAEGLTRLPSAIG